MSKFKQLLDAANQREPGSTVNCNPESAHTPVVGQLLVSRAGRPRGKRSNPEYEQVTAYIKRETHRDVKLWLLQEDCDSDFSDLIENLLVEFLRTQKLNHAKV